MRDMSRRSRFAAAFALLLLPSMVLAQARAGDDANAASPLAATYQRIGETVAQQIIGGDDAASHWMSGRFAPLDPAVQLREYAAAAARDPKEPLYVASLADTCMRVFSPVPAECSDRDTIGYWSSRDPDNAVPWLLQAERARRRNNVSSIVENLERAAASPRYDDYAGRAGGVVAAKLVPRAAPADRAATVLYAQQQGAMPLSSPLAALEAVCAPSTRALEERIGRSCIRLGALMAERAASYANRRAGAQIAFASATTDSARAATNEAARAAVAMSDRCREAVATLERYASGGPGERERAAATGSRFLDDRSSGGEPAACEALAKSLAGR